jgi:Ca2+-binding RTX toxin-like protein
MKKRLFPRFVFLMLIVLVLVSAVNAVAAGNFVPVTRLGEYSRPTTISDFTPESCSSLGITNIVTGSGVFFGTAGNDLILGSSSGDWIFDFGGGNDCIVGGGGDDWLWGGPGTDVCIGRPGNDAFTQCETQNP